MNLNELFIKLSSLSRSALVMISGAVTFIYYSAIYDDGSAVTAAIASTQAELVIQREKEKESDIAIREVDIVKSSLEALTQQFNIVSAQLPRELQMAEVIRMVDVIAKQSELTIRTKEPKPYSKDKGIEVLPIQITADGNFSQIVKFLHYLTAVERIFRVNSVVIRTEEENRTNVSLIKLKMDVASYRFVPEEVLESKEVVRWGNGWGILSGSCSCA